MGGVRIGRQRRAGVAPWPRGAARPVLLVLCGPSHAGKSAFARRRCKGFAVVSSDRVRERLGAGFGRPDGERRVWRAFDAEKRRALRAGRSVVLDACHMSGRARRHALEGAAGHEKVCVVFDVPLKVALARCRKTGRVSQAEVRRMWRAFRACRPTREGLKAEGFDGVVVVRPGHDVRRRRVGRRGLPASGCGWRWWPRACGTSA